MTNQNIHQHTYTVSRNLRNDILGHKSIVLWFVGLSGSGKSTIANSLEERLIKNQVLTRTLDGDHVRSGLNRDLGFSEEDRKENLRRIAEVAKIFCDTGCITITAFISPTQESRDIAKVTIGTQDFIEVFIDAPLATCEERDVKGLYKKARAGNIPNFTGINAPFEIPKNPDIHLETKYKNLHECVDMIIDLLISREIIPRKDYL